jgi:CheY-like chemotaxis protein
MDYMMPDMDGIETIRIIREEIGTKYAKNIPIIALTANAIQGSREMFLANSFDDFLSKPIDVSELNNVLKKWLPSEKVRTETDVQNNIQNNINEEAHSDEPLGIMETLEKIDGLSVGIGLSNFSGMKEMYLDAVEFFCKKFTAECERMSFNFNEKDTKAFAISVHTFKSQLATIGASDLSETALKLETASNNGDFDFCIETYPRFYEDINSLYDKISVLFVTAEVTKNSGDPAYLQENLPKIFTAIDDFDRDVSLDIVKDLIAYDYGEKINEVLEKSALALEDFDLDIAAELLKPLMEV